MQFTFQRNVRRASVGPFYFVPPHNWIMLFLYARFVYRVCFNSNVPIRRPVTALLSILKSGLKSSYSRLPIGYLCAVWGCTATTAGSNYQTPCIREHWSAESIVSPPLCTYTRGGYVQRGRPLGHYHPIGWLGRGSDYRLHPGALALCTLAKSNRMPAGTDGVCEEIVARGESIRGRYGAGPADSAICTNVCGNHYGWMSVGVE